MTGSRKRKVEVRKERKKKKNEEEEKEGEREEGEKRDGRAKNRQRPGRKEGAENEGELRSALESPAASRSALSRWISSGRYRSPSLFAPRFSLSFPSPLPAATGSNLLPLRPSTTSLTRTRSWRGRSSPLSPLVSAPAAERPCASAAPPLHDGVQHRASTPGGIFCTTIGTNVYERKRERQRESGRKKGEHSVLLLLPRRVSPRFQPRANRNDSPCTYTHVCMCEDVGVVRMCMVE